MNSLVAAIVEDWVIVLAVSFGIGKAPCPNLGTVTDRFQTLHRFPQSQEKFRDVNLHRRIWVVNCGVRTQNISYLQRAV